MISLDVVSLFTSISVDFGIEIIESKWDLIHIFIKMTMRPRLNIIKFCMIDNRYITYVKGMPMGSPASPVIADIVMENLLNESFKN